MASPSYQRELPQLSVSERLSIPLRSYLDRPQKEGSVFWDSRLQGAFLSTGSELAGIAAWVRGDDVTQITTIATAVATTGTSGLITTVAATTAADAVSTFTVTNANVLASSLVVLNLVNYSGAVVTNGVPLLIVSAIDTGSFVVNLVNVGTAALAGTVSLAFFIL